MKNLSVLYFSLCFLLLISGCKQEVAQEIQEEKVAVTLDSLSKEKIESDLLSLSPEATKDLESFEDLQNLQSLVKSMHSSNPYYIKKYADSINVLIQTVDENISEDLKKNTITSRLVVLSTASALLKQVADKNNPTSEQLLEANKKMITAYNSLIIQLNELSLAIPENIEKELLRDKEIIPDSVEDSKKNLEE